MNNSKQRTLKEILEDGVLESEYNAEGGEAAVDFQIRTKIPGVGGAIITSEGAVVALRREHSVAKGSGHRMFLRHMVAKKLEDYFFRTGVYKYAHIPRPLGSISFLGTDSEKPYECYFYEWTFGSEGFYWESQDYGGVTNKTELSDWNSFVGKFSEAGIVMCTDVTESDDARISKNIIHQILPAKAIYEKLNAAWKRIDFGRRSLSIDFDVLQKYLHDNRDDLRAVLRTERYNMLDLAVEYLIKGPEKMRAGDIGKLEVYIGDYRRESLKQYSSTGSAPKYKQAYIDEGQQTLFY